MRNRDVPSSGRKPTKMLFFWQPLRLYDPTEAEPEEEDDEEEEVEAELAAEEVAEDHEDEDPFFEDHDSSPDEDEDEPSFESCLYAARGALDCFAAEVEATEEEEFE